MDFCRADRTRELLLDAKAGDETAFEQLVSAYRPMLDSVVGRYKIDQAEGFSEALYGFYRAVSSYKLDSENVTFGLYAKICVERCIIDLLRKKGRDVSLYIDADIDVDQIAVSDGVQAMLEHREQMSMFLRIARETLSDFEYSVYRLWMLGYRTADIAASLSATAKSVDNAKNRMLAKLRARLSQQN